MKIVSERRVVNYNCKTETNGEFNHNEIEKSKMVKSGHVKDYLLSSASNDIEPNHLSSFCRQE